MSAMKVGRWLEKQYIIMKSARNDEDEPPVSYLDPNGYATDELYEAAFYEGQDAAEAAKTDAKHEGPWNVSPLAFHLRDKREFGILLYSHYSDFQFFHIGKSIQNNSIYP